jgi:MFS family permease
MMTTGARRWLALLAVAMSLLVVGLDLTVLNLALPSIANALHASTSDLQWFSDAYSLVLALAFLPRRARDGAVRQQEPIPAGSGETSSERGELGI